MIEKRTITQLRELVWQKIKLAVLRKLVNELLINLIISLKEKMLIISGADLC